MKKFCFAASVRYSELLPYNHLLTHWPFFHRIINSIFRICAVRLHLMFLTWYFSTNKNTRFAPVVVNSWTSRYWQTFKMNDKNHVLWVEYKSHLSSDCFDNPRKKPVLLFAMPYFHLSPLDLLHNWSRLCGIPFWTSLSLLEV